MAIKKVYDLSVDLKRTRIKANVPVLVQGDSTEFRLRLLENGKELTPGQISGVTSVELLSGYDAQTIIRTVGTMQGSEAVFSIGQGELFKTGQVKAMVRLADADDRISTLNFEYRVISDLTANYVPGEQDVSIFQQYIADAQQKIDEMAATDVQQLSAQLAETDGRISNIIAHNGDGTKDTEIIDAQQSSTKNKSFTVIGERFEELEESTHFPIKNAITNGQFAANFSPWNVGTTTASVSSNKLILDFPTTSSQNIIYPGSRVAGHKYYGRITFEQLAGSFAGQTLFVGGVNKDFTSTLNTPNVISRIETAPSVGGSLFQFTLVTPTAGAKVAISKPVFINLTETFGVGKEPTIAEIELLLSRFPSSFFEGTQQLLNVRQLTNMTLQELKKKANTTDIVDSTENKLFDADVNDEVVYSTQKENNEVELRWDTQEATATLNSEAVPGVTFSQLFVGRNRLANSHFTNDLTGYTITSGTPTVSNSIYNTPSKSMKVFGTTSQYVLAPFPSDGVGKKFFIAGKIRVDRFVSGNGLGFQINKPGQSVARAAKHVTNGFETHSTIYNMTSASTNLVLGSMGNSNLDGYIDDFMMIDITGLPVTDTTEMTRLYELYLKMLKGETASEPIVKKYRLATQEKTAIHFEDALNAFVSEMNTKAQEIGMTDSVFTNPVGADNGSHYMTAKDMVKMGISASGYSEMLKAWNKKTYTVKVQGANARNVAMETSVTDPLLEDHYHIFGGKTGTTTVQNLLVLVNAPNGDIFVGSVIGATANRFDVAKSLFDIAELYMDEGYTGTHDVAASKAAVAVLPKHHPFTYEGYDIPMLWSKSDSVQEFPASVTKVMSVMVLLDYVKDIHEKIEVKHVDVTSGSGDFFKDGDIVTFKDAIYAMMLPSSNTLANAAARAVGEKIIRNSRV